MKSLAVIFVLLLSGWQVDSRVVLVKSSEGRREFSADEESCMTELNLDREKILAVNKIGILPEDNEDFSEFMGCIGKKGGLIMSNGEISFDTIKDLFLKAGKKDPAAVRIFKPLVTNAVEHCQRNPPSGSTEGQTLIKTLNCIVRALAGSF